MPNELVGEAGQIHLIFLLTHNWQSTWRGIEPAGIRHPFLEREQHRHGIGGWIDKAEAGDSCVPEGATAVEAAAGAKDGAGEIEEPSGEEATTLERPLPWGKEWTGRRGLLPPELEAVRAGALASDEGVRDGGGAVIGDGTMDEGPESRPVTTRRGGARDS